MTRPGTQQPVRSGTPPSKPRPPTKPRPSGGKHDLRMLVARRVLDAKRDAAVAVGGRFPSDDTKIAQTAEYQHALYMCRTMAEVQQKTMEIRNGWRHEDS